MVAGFDGGLSGRPHAAESVSKVGFEASLENAPPDLRDLAIALRSLELAQRDLRQRFARRLGLSSTDYSAVMLIGQWGEVTPKEIAEELNMTAGAVTSLIDRLEHSGYVSRLPHPTDRRSLHIALSEKAAEAKVGIYRDYFNGISRAAARHPEMLLPEVTRALTFATSAAESIS